MANPSLSVVLPVHNAEQSLGDKISQLLDILPDLTSNFEILVINDGSTDHTEEIAYELARVYPQVRIKRHMLRRGHQGAVETGLAETSADILFVQDENAPIDSSKLHRLWDLRNEEDFVFGQPEVQVKRSLIQRLAAWGLRLEDDALGGHSAGVQMIRRRSQPRLSKLSSSKLSAGHVRVNQADDCHDTQSGPKFAPRERTKPFSPSSLSD